jgi:prevent-host-death family protein
MKLKGDVIPVTTLKSNASQLVQDASEKGRTIVITQNGEAKAVLIGIGTFDRWRRVAFLMKLIAQGEADVAAGRILTGKKAFERAARAIEQASEER